MASAPNWQVATAPMRARFLVPWGREPGAKNKKNTDSLVDASTMLADVPGVNANR